MFNVTGTFNVTVTEFCLPNGTRREWTVPISSSLTEAYDRMIAAGCRLEMETLRTGERSVTVSDDTMDRDILVSPGCVPPHLAINKLLERI